MKIFLKSLAALLFLTLVIWAIRSDSEPDTGQVNAASLAPAAPPAGGDPAWRRSPLWDDGKAEFCAYDVTWARYGHHFEGRALLVLVKEPWAPDLDVKADSPRKDGFDVLKLNHIRDVAIGIYTYHQMASVYTRRDSGALRKIAATSSEACGVSTADVVKGTLRTRSYFDGQGDRSTPWPANALPEDGLPASLRDYVAGPAPATVQVFPSLLAGRFQKLEPAVYQVKKKEAADGVEIRLTSGPSVLAYTFEKESPHRLVRFEREDGTVYRLAKCERIPYWEMHDPGDEGWWPAPSPPRGK
ncbi:MAG TPA: hypothetical protein VG477_12165 [Thermoanaerobaculia bacterium]|nr:hypothetical protein [Thermoanaerobaculia bacterium]